MQKLSVAINPDFEKRLEEKARELIAKQEKKGEVRLDESRKATLELFIDEKPTVTMFSFDVDNHKVYIGANV